EEIQLVDGNGRPVATPSAPDAEGDGFNVCTYAASCGTPSSSAPTTRTHGHKHTKRSISSGQRSKLWFDANVQNDLNIRKYERSPARPGQNGLRGGNGGRVGHVGRALAAPGTHLRD